MANVKTRLHNKLVLLLTIGSLQFTGTLFNCNTGTLLMYHIHMSALGYDAASLLITEIKNNKAYDRVSLLTAMMNLKSFYRVTGNMDFNKTPDPHKGFYIIQISNKGAQLKEHLQSI